MTFPRTRVYRSGFTMIELLVTLSILSLVIITIYFLIGPKYLNKANDSRRKTDLQAYKIALEHYYEDNGKCYPQKDTDGMYPMEYCESNQMSPYLPKVLCDPRTKDAYTFVIDGCNSFRVYAKLSDSTDESIASVGCDDGCGLDENINGAFDDVNYGVSSENVQVGVKMAYGLQDTRGTPEDPTDDTCAAGRCSEGCPSQNYLCSSSGNYCIEDLVACP